MYAMTAAHKTLPLGTFVRVRNLANNREVEVRINDRGPFVRDRIIDLSYAAAEEIGIVVPGTAPARVEALGVSVTSEDNAAARTAPLPADYFFTGNFSIQVGAFSSRPNAERLKKRLEKHYENVRIIPFEKGNETFYRVRIGRFTDLNKAEASEGKLISSGFSDAFIVAD
jgi:rare lipoprotein A